MIHRLAYLLLLSSACALPAADPVLRNVSSVFDRGGLPYRVHAFEDFETTIEKRWWLRGRAVTKSLPESLSSLPNRRLLRAVKSKDFDRKMGDRIRRYKAVVFNPVPGPPMGKRTQLSFRYRLEGTDMLRVQLYSLTNNYHRYLVLRGLPQGQWQAATVDMTEARRPDGSGGPLSEDERIDDIQFYTAHGAELKIDDIVLYDRAVEGEQRPFPKRIIFTGWFDTGKQGKEWPGDFEIVLHKKPLTWDAARAVVNKQTSRPWIRVYMRGPRPLGKLNRLRFRYRLDREVPLTVTLANGQTGWMQLVVISQPKADRWGEAVVDFVTQKPDLKADEIRFSVDQNIELLVDDLLLYEPGD
jgi:hypothetical protein